MSGKPGLRAILLLAALVASLLRVSGVNPAVAQTSVVGAWTLTADPGLDGTAATWQSIPPVWVAMTPQNVTAPMGGGEVARVAVRAAHYQDRLFVMLEWVDPSPDLDAARVEDYPDAAAIQFPAEAGTGVPALCMGQADQAVNIWQWRADLAGGDGTVPEGAQVDLYPSTDDLYFPARHLGNAVSSGSPVQNLLAGGFGTLTPADSQVVEGQGAYRGGTWSVVFSRRFASPGSMQPGFQTGSRIDAAFAIWDGASDNRDGIKSVSTFVQLQPSDQAPPHEAAARSATGALVLVAVSASVLITVVVMALRDAGPRVRGDG
jgi:hypothetical protein